MKTRTLQQIFNAVIAGGFYAETEKTRQSKYMCIALDFALDGGVVTQKEFNKATKAIHNYMNTFCDTFTTGESLCGTFIRYYRKTGKLGKYAVKYYYPEIYSNWKNRPKPAKIQFKAN